MFVNLTINCFHSSAIARADLSPLQGNYFFRQLEAHDFQSSQLGRESNRAERFAERLAEGHEAWGYVDSTGSVACYLWLTMGPNVNTKKKIVASFECGLKAEIPVGAAYIWDCRSHPAHYGKGLYRHGLRSLRDVVADRGASNVLIVCRQGNTRSTASILKVGFKQIAVLRLHAFRGLVVLRGTIGFKILRTGAALQLPDRDELVLV